MSSKKDMEPISEAPAPWDEPVRKALHSSIDRFFDRISGKREGCIGQEALFEASSCPDIGELELIGMLKELNELDEDAWSRYVISNDLLRNKVNPIEGAHLAAQARECGRAWAIRMRDEQQAASPDELARHLGVEVCDNNAPVSGKRVLFAQFVPDNHIDLMADPLRRYRSLRSHLLQGVEGAQRDGALGLLPTPETTRELILSHELFHVIEDQNESEIFTRTATIRLQKFFGFENRSTLRSLGEIGAGAFAQEYVGSSFNPFALDILLSWAYDAELSRSLYRDVLACR